MKRLQDIGYGATGTIRDNRCNKCPLKSVASMKKEPRGTIDFVTDGKNKMVACRWMDNSVVTIASTVQVAILQQK